MSKIWRQGDVVVSEVSEVPENAVCSDLSEIRIVSETGNPHVLRAAQIFETRDDRGNLGAQQQYVLLEEETAMTHPQHAELRIPPGVYRIATVRDYAPARRLLD
jgi:hypothetical protein